MESRRLPSLPPLPTLYHLPIEQIQLCHRVFGEATFGVYTLGLEQEDEEEEQGED